MHPYFYAESSVKKWGGQVEDYLPIHSWFDESKAHLADVRHRALRHHSEGIFLAEALFGNTITNLPIRLVGWSQSDKSVNAMSSETWGEYLVPPIGSVPSSPSLGCFAGRKRWLLNWTPSRKKPKQNYVIDMTASTKEHVINVVTGCYRA